MLDELKLGVPINPRDLVWIKAYNWCVNRSIPHIVEYDSTSSILRALYTFTEDCISDMNVIRCVVEKEPDADGPRDEALTINKFGGTWGGDVVFNSYWQHRYNLDLRIKYSDKAESYEVFHDNTKLSLSENRLFDLLWNWYSSNLQGLELRCNIQDKSFMYFFDYNKNIVFFSVEDTIVGPRVHLYSPGAVAKCKPEWLSAWNTHIDDYLLVDEYVRYCILNRKYPVCNHIIMKDKVYEV